MRCAYIIDTVVREVFEVQDLAKERELNFAAMCQPCGPEVQEGWTWDGTAFQAPAEEPGPGLEAVKAAKLAEVWGGSDAILQTLRSRYSKPEQESWPKQEADAKALLADPDAPAVTLRGIATRAGRDLTELRDKVLANVLASEVAYGEIIGQQQAFERQLAAIQVGEGMTEEQAVVAVQAIVVSYSLPGA